MSEEESVHNSILYVDDDEKSRLLLRKILEPEGFVVSDALNGLEAVEKASQDPPDLIIMDIQMPVMDGFDALKRMQEIPDLEGVPTIALTARGVAGDREKIIKAGFHGYLSKPVQRLLLIEEVVRLLTPRDHISPEEKEGEPLFKDDILKGKSVLLVDDSPVHLQMGEKILGSCGMKVLKAVDGKDAMRTLESSVKVDLILSDILMPGMDGYQFCRMVKTTGALMGTPFVFYTSTYADNNDVRFGLDLGADRYIIRPITSKRFLEIVGEVLREKEEKGKKFDAPGEAIMVDDLEYYREYNERLISKLEQKLLEVEEAHRTLEVRNEELQSSDQTMEDRIRERTLELEDRNRHLVEMDEKKAKLLKSLAGDLKTSLAAIRSYTDLLLKSMDKPEKHQEELFNKMFCEIKRLEERMVTTQVDRLKTED